MRSAGWGPVVLYHLYLSSSLNYWYRPRKQGHWRLEISGVLRSLIRSRSRSRSRSHGNWSWSRPQSHKVLAVVKVQN